jgi:hypothetical protein
MSRKTGDARPLRDYLEVWVSGAPVRPQLATRLYPCLANSWSTSNKLRLIGDDPVRGAVTSWAIAAPLSTSWTE